MLQPELGEPKTESTEGEGKSMDPIHGSAHVQSSSRRWDEVLNLQQHLSPGNLDRSWVIHLDISLGLG